MSELPADVLAHFRPMTHAELRALPPNGSFPALAVHPRWPGHIGLPCDPWSLPREDLAEMRFLPVYEAVNLLSNGMEGMDYTSLEDLRRRCRNPAQFNRCMCCGKPDECRHALPRKELSDWPPSIFLRDGDEEIEYVRSDRAAIAKAQPASGGSKRRVG